MNLRTQMGAALALLFTASAVLNSSVFPEVATVGPAAREVSTLCGALFALAVAAAAYFRPSLVRERGISVVLLVALAVSLAVLVLGLEFGIPVLVEWGAPLGGIGSAWFSVLAGVGLTRLTMRDALLVIPAAYGVSYGVTFLLRLAGTLPTAVAVLLYFLCLAGVFVCVMPRTAELFQRIRQQEAPEVLDVTNPSSFLPLASVVYVTIFLFNAAFGYGTVQVEGRLPLLGLVLSFVPVGLVLALAVSHWVRVLSPDALQRASSLLVLAGFLLVPLTVFDPGPSSWTNVSSSVLLQGGADCFGVLTYFIVARVGARNPLGALTTSAGATAAAWVGIAAGAMLSSALEGMAAGNPALLMGASAALTFGFVAYSFVAVKPGSFTQAIDGVLPVLGPEGDEKTDGKDPKSGLSEDARRDEADKAFASEEALGSEQRLDEACAAVAQRFGLTAREVDVLQLLARGRTASVIQERLVLSHNTVKSHVRHIYSKLGVHSQQQLIDLVDRVEG
ncbi:helix-turn-helix transcriptional regulator [Adlercreutzia equolifaciens]|uniref:response regulator transcription factor n=1 Tax=Adlercreutzia equolifaciens TaxID=446660 RepID=UPI0023AF81A7|nr:helix-turn-helix transcriptional regulator [Adlercreutzia equolifaciens]MDE8702221.1 helix-turn-helix transcriptional regulator [Adlercreutzia equolifaciens]